MSSAMDDNVFHFVADQSLHVNVVRNFHCLRMNEQLLDVKLKAGDTTVSAHRSYLAAFSPYFAKLFSEGMLERDMGAVELKDVDGSALSQIIEFAYSSKIDITDNNWMSILETANYMCIDMLCDACFNFIFRKLSIDNVVELIALTTTFHGPKFHEQAKIYALEHFEQLQETDAFVTIDPSVFLQLVCDPRLVCTESGFCVGSVRQEQLVLNSVLMYVKQDEKNRVEVLKNYLSHAVNSKLISQEILSDARSLVSDFRQLASALDSVVPGLPQSCVPSFRKMIGLRFTCSPDRPLADTMQVESEVTPRAHDDFTGRSGGDYVVGMNIYVRRWDGRPVIGGLLIKYSSGEEKQLGNDGECRQFHLAANERITGVSARSGWMVDQLTFFTNHNRTFGPYGGPGGGDRRVDNCDGSYLVGVKCRVDKTQGLTAVRCVQFVWANYQYTSKS